MALVCWPMEKHMRRMSVLKAGHPFILEASGEYPDGVNWYLFERCRGRIDASDLTAPRSKPIDHHITTLSRSSMQSPMS